MKNAIEKINEDRIAGSIEQTTVNLGLKAWSEGAAPHARITLDEVRVRAEKRVDAERYPQYRGHFERYVVVRMTRRIATKLGTAFERGDLTIARWEEADERYDLPAGWVAFSFRNGCNTGVGMNARAFDVASGCDAGGAR